MKLVTILDRIGAKVNKHVEDVNYGGCAVFAAAVAPHLQPLVPDLQVKVGYDEDYGHKNLNRVRSSIPAPARLHLTEWHKRGVCFGHVVLSFTHKGVQYCYDSNGVVQYDGGYDPTYGYRLYGGSVTIEEVISFASTPKGWNHTFERGHIPLLYQIVADGFEKYHAAVARKRADKKGGFVVPARTIDSRCQF